MQAGNTAAFFMSYDRTVQITNSPEEEGTHGKERKVMIT